jgi:mannose-6-phosphate isomerase-like protein (cupin superfamily)
MYIEDIEKAAEENTNFRKVLYTGTHSQLVVMRLQVGEEIGEEVHPDVDQIILIVEGKAQAIINGEERDLGEDELAFVPAGARHNVKNTGDEALKLFTVYSPPEHPDGTIHRTKAEAEHAEV